MKYTSAFIFSLLLCCASIQAQVKTESGHTDSLPVKTDRYGLRVGVDLAKLARTAYDDNYKGLELVGDYRLTKKIWLAGELGNENKLTDDSQLDFRTKGTYFKVGFDYNTYENWLDMENQITIGLRYGVSSFSQELVSYEIYNPHPYFGQAPVVISGEEFTSLSASWLEVVAGVKVELFNNFYAGFSLRLNRILTNKRPDNFDNLYIPGYARTYNGEFGANWNYTVSYFIPIYKKKVKQLEEKTTPEKKK